MLDFFRTAGRAAVAAACVFVPVAVPAVASAQTIAESIAALSSPSAAEVQTAIEEIGLAGDPRAVVPLSDRIRAGLSPELLGMAVDTLTVLGRAEAGPVLVELLSHRRADVRTRAVQALAVCHPAGASAALARALDDGSPAVRAAAAIALAELGDASAVDPLFRAFERGVAEAGMAIARLGDAAAVARVLGYLGREPFSTLRPMLLAMLERADLAQRARLDIVARVGELATSDARGLLQEVVSGGRLRTSDPVHRAANEAAARIPE